MNVSSGALALPIVTTTRRRGADRAEVLPDLVRAFYEVSAVANRQSREILDGLELTEPMAGVLWMLDPLRPPTSMREIARGLGCDPSNVTLIVDKLANSQLVVREVSPRDARARILRLTRSGEELRQRLVDGLITVTPLSSLSHSEQTGLLHVLRRLGANR